METILINGRELPVRKSLGAFKRFDVRFKGEISVLEMEHKTFTIEHMTAFIWYVVEAGIRFGGNAPEYKDISEEWIEDNATIDDIEAIFKVINPEATDEKKS